MPAPSHRKLETRNYQLSFSVSQTRRRLLRLQLAYQNADYHAVIAGAAQLGQFGECLLAALCGSEGAVVGHVDVSIGDGDDARPQRDLFAAQSGWISCAVEGFVVMLDCLLQLLAPRNRAHDLRSHLGMQSDEIELFFRKRAGFVQDALGNENLSSIVNRPA